MTNKAAELVALIENAEWEFDFVKACLRAGGHHEHSFWVAVDEEELQKAHDLIEGFAERIRRELERPLMDSECVG